MCHLSYLFGQRQGRHTSVMEAYTLLSTVRNALTSPPFWLQLAAKYDHHMLLLLLLLLIAVMTSTAWHNHGTCFVRR